MVIIQIAVVLILLVMLGYLIQRGAALLNVPNPIVQFVLLVLGFVFIIYVLSTFSLIPSGWSLR